MKQQRNLVIFILIILSNIVFANDITGDWYGAIDIGGTKLRLVFHIKASMMGYSGTMDSPDQNAFGIPVSTVSFSDNNLKIDIKNIGMSYAGALNHNAVVEGMFTQRGMQLPLTLEREEIKKEEVMRPQTPKPPFPYKSEDIHFYNGDIKFAGTLTIPQGNQKHPAVIMISGSGAQNRDEEIFEHKPFAVIADYLTRKGIAVLRYDDRGTAESEGNFATATSADFAKDAEAALNYLLTREEIDHEHVGLMGHSEGGLIAPMIAAENDNVDFIILLAGPGLPGDELLLLQLEAIAKASDMNDSDLQSVKAFNKGAFDIVLSIDGKDLEHKLKDYFDANLDKLPEGNRPPKKTQKDFITQQIKQLTTPWLIYFLKHDPAENLVKIKCPILAVNGAKDLQVPADINLKAIKDAAQSTTVETKKFENLNHLFQNCETGLVSEYGKIEETFAPEVLEYIANWITKNCK